MTGRTVTAATLLFMAIAGALIGGLAYGPMLDAGRVVVLSCWPFVLAAAAIVGLVTLNRHTKWSAAAAFGWAFTGSWFSVLVLGSVAAQAVPSPEIWSLPRRPEEAREPLALNTGLDLFWNRSRMLHELETAYEVDRLDELSSRQLSKHRYLLLAQPRLLMPEELVAIDGWVREGGRALILADPLLLWPSELATGDRRRPPATSLLDPLLAHWGLTLEPAPSDDVRRRFVGDRLLFVQGASHFKVQPSRFAHCAGEVEGLMATCRLGRGQVRLIADADLLDERLWLTQSDGLLRADNMALIKYWLRSPLSAASNWPGAATWARSMDEVAIGLRWALLFAGIWSIAGAATFVRLQNRKLLRSKATGEEHS